MKRKTGSVAIMRRSSPKLKQLLEQMVKKKVSFIDMRIFIKEINIIIKFAELIYSKPPPKPDRKSKTSKLIGSGILGDLTGTSNFGVKKVRAFKKQGLKAYMKASRGKTKVASLAGSSKAHSLFEDQWLNLKSSDFDTDER
jgi:hypothetical protein